MVKPRSKTLIDKPHSNLSQNSSNKKKSRLMPKTVSEVDDDSDDCFSSSDFLDQTSSSFGSDEDFDELSESGDGT